MKKKQVITDLDYVKSLPGNAIPKYVHDIMAIIIGEGEGTISHDSIQMFGNILTNAGNDRAKFVNDECRLYNTLAGDPLAVLEGYRQLMGFGNKYHDLITPLENYLDSGLD